MFRFIDFVRMFLTIDATSDTSRSDMTDSPFSVKVTLQSENPDVTITGKRSHVLLNHDFKKVPNSKIMIFETASDGAIQL